MITSNPNSICEQAGSYYYKYLCKDRKEFVPKEILAHINQCELCRSEVTRLKTVLSEAEKSESTAQTTSAIATNLGFHFAHAGASVDCHTVKPFLPVLVHSMLAVSVPTPITVHLDKCQHCADDLQTIRRLNLTDRQLCRLGRLFADEPLCQHRSVVDKGLPDGETGDQQFSCEALQAADIFDHCFPSGADPAADDYTKSRSSFTAHAAKCPICLGKMQELHDTVYGIMERKESGIVTCFKVVGEARKSAVSEADDQYEGWPIEVQVFKKSTDLHASERPHSGDEKDVAALPERKERVSMLNIAPFVKPAAIAAAIALVAILLLNTPVARAVDLTQLYEALARMKNISLATFAPGEDTPTQQIWASRTLNVMVNKTGAELVVWDVRNRVRKSRDLGTGSVDILQLDANAVTKASELLHSPFGILPFDDVSRIPADGKWEEVRQVEADAVALGTKVYDFLWVDKRLSGAPVYQKWRGYIDTEAKLPKKIERWERQQDQDEYEMVSVIEVAYPTAAEISAVVLESGF